MNIFNYFSWSGLTRERARHTCANLTTQSLVSMTFHGHRTPAAFTRVTLILVHMTKTVNITSVFRFNDCSEARPIGLSLKNCYPYPFQTSQHRNLLLMHGIQTIIQVDLSCCWLQCNRLIPCRYVAVVHVGSHYYPCAPAVPLRDKDNTIYWKHFKMWNQLKTGINLICRDCMVRQ